MILFVAVAELVGLGDDPRLHRRLAETKVPQRSQREPPLLKKFTINLKSGRMRRIKFSYFNKNEIVRLLPDRASSRRRS